MLGVIILTTLISSVFAAGGLIPDLTPQLDAIAGVLNQVNNKVQVAYDRMKWIYVSSIFSFIAFWLCLIIIAMLLFYHKKHYRR